MASVKRHPKWNDALRTTKEKTHLKTMKHRLINTVSIALLAAIITITGEKAAAPPVAVVLRNKCTSLRNAIKCVKSKLFSVAGVSKVYGPRAGYGPPRSVIRSAEIRQI